MASLRPSNHRNNNRNPNSATGGKFLTLSMEFDQKSDNLQYNTLVRWFAGTNDSSTKCPMFQVLFFFIFFSYFLAEFFTKIVSIYFFFFYKFTKIKIKSFECPKSIRNYKKNNAWNITRLVDESFVQANQQTSVLY